MYEREQALGKYMGLKKQIYELGVRAQALVNDIQEETESFLSDKDFTSMDFSKVIVLANELKTLQMSYQEKAAQFENIRAKYNFTD